VFRFLHGFDQPYNLFPSLHITLWAILADFYAKHTRGLLRALCHGWFSLICVSTLLTYQHHLVDVIGGFVLAVFCFYIVRETRVREAAMPNYRVGGYYFAGAFVCLVLVPIGWPWTVALLWPAVSLGITASGYFGLGPVIYRKQAGRIPLSARLLLAPSLAGQILSLAYYRRQCLAWSRVTPHVWIGARLNAREAREAKRQGVTAVLDLTAEFSETREFLEVNYRNIPVLDLTSLSVHQLSAAVEFISKHAGTGVVYVHCKVGYSRSAAAVGAYLLASGQAATIEQALAMQRSARPPMVFRPEVNKALEGYRAAPRVAAQSLVLDK
jgi:protein-tyrosine phosphatase